ncbi:Aste57867_2666 [Aphanomyces stellatus]|uniref:Aste57867_2666 protein n=1 Tax=Aphanomyces stellatus TaxID=120398 RepID=A0A485K9P9_9STRA|nr:hypothetical protein As57867_002659 [Aphanomyces stellatus]VFT79860.1 Aste57867_2666 [Aphanomyces stellatus]
MMKKFLICALLTAVHTAVHALNVDEETASLRDVAAFVQYMADFEKPYRNHGEDHPLVMKRFKAFQTNLKRIEEHNRGYDAGEHTFALGLNHLADLTDDEYNQMLNLQQSTSPSKAAYTYEDPHNENAPDSWDWREHNVVTPVKNQGQCGSCWAFSAVAAMESTYALATGKLESFSEQELVDCVDGGADDCTHGGLIEHGFSEVIEHHQGKIEREKDYPYTAASEHKCLAKDNKAVGHFTSYVNVTGGEDALKSAVATHGVIAVAIDASSFLFQLYKHGVFSYWFCLSAYGDLNHGVAAAGYGNYKGKDYWLVKNSWGPGWGQGGYILMSRNKNNQCGIATQPRFPIMPKQKPDDIAADTVANWLLSH